MANAFKIYSLILLLGILLIPAIIASDSNPTYCCEKLKGTGDNVGSCISAPISQCNDSLRKVQSSCENTNYCQVGTCFDSSSGLCGANTAKSTCLASGGEFIAQKIEQAPQCQLGCCVLLENAKITTLTQCKSLGTFSGINAQYDPSITSSSECIAKSQTKDMGACVTQTDTGRQCILTSRGECGGSEGSIVSGLYQEGDIKTFYSGYLCSAGALATTCAKQAKTECAGQDDEDVYWFDSCGNKENIYTGLDNSETIDKISDNNGLIANIDDLKKKTSDVKGNCDYLGSDGSFGTVCAQKTKEDGTDDEESTKVTNFCRNTSCTYDGEPKRNTESWCETDPNNKNPILKINSENKFVNDSSSKDPNTSAESFGLEPVGAEYIRKQCLDGEIITDSCMSYRKEVCIEGTKLVSDDEYQPIAGCVANRWESCLIQTNKDDCNDYVNRDCVWLSSESGEIEILADTNSRLLITEEGIEISKQTEKERDGKQKGVCVPRSSPGFDGTSSDELCHMASVSCEVTYERGFYAGAKNWYCDKVGFFCGDEAHYNKDGEVDETLTGDEGFKIIKNKECTEQKWAVAANKICVRQGDCGSYNNIEGEHYKENGYSIKASIEPGFEIVGLQNELNKWIDEKT